MALWRGWGRREKSPGLSPSVSSGFSPRLPFPPSFGRARATIQHGRRTGRRTKQAAHTAPHYTDSSQSPSQATPATQRTVKTRVEETGRGGERKGCIDYSFSAAHSACAPPPPPGACWAGWRPPPQDARAGQGCTLPPQPLPGSACNSRLPKGLRAGRISLSPARAAAACQPMQPTTPA